MPTAAIGAGIASVASSIGSAVGTAATAVGSALGFGGGAAAALTPEAIAASAEGFGGLAAASSVGGTLGAAASGGGLFSSFSGISSVAGLVGSGVTAMGDIEQGKAAQAAANYSAQVAQNNATIANQNKTVAAQQGEATAEQVGIANANKIGQIRAAYGAGEVDPNTGSAAQVEQSQRELGALSQSNTMYQSQLQQYGYAAQAEQFQSQAALDIFSGQQAVTAGLFGAGGSLLQGIGTFGSRYAYMQNTQVPGAGTLTAGLPPL